MLADNAVEIVLNERKVYEVDWLEDSYKRVSNNFGAKIEFFTFINQLDFQLHNPNFPVD